MEQDIHQVNADKLESSRRQVKELHIVSCMEGATRNLALLRTMMLSPEAAKKRAEIRLSDAVEGLEDLVEATRRVAEEGSIRAIDKRTNHCGQRTQSIKLFTTRVSSSHRKALAPTNTSKLRSLDP